MVTLVVGASGATGRLLVQHFSHRIARWPVGRVARGTARFGPMDRPSKICAVCGRPFAWRKKWERCWDDVRYCSERCRRSKNRAA